MATWSYEQDFEGLTAGSSLVGQDSWAAVGANPEPVVINTLGDGDSQCVEINVGTAANRLADRNVTAATDDGSTVYFSIRTNDITNTRSNNIILRTTRGGSEIMRFQIVGKTTQSDIEYKGNASFVSLVTNISVDTWYRVGIEFDFTNTRFRVNVNNGTFSSWETMTTSSSQVGYILLFGSGTESVIYYVDNISADYSAAAGPSFTPQVVFY